MKNNMEKIDKAIEILQAFKEGKKIEIWDNKKWLPIDKYEEICRDLYHYHDTLRVKPQSTYRPYANAEEFLKASKEHGGYLITKSYRLEDNSFIPNRINCHGITWLTKDLGWRFLTYEGLLRDYIWIKDSQPCGILEQ